MISLKNVVKDKGYDVVHIKTDSIKIPNPTEEIIDFVTEFGKRYGYDFEHEETYNKFCLVNNAVYIARIDGWETSKSEKLKKNKGWTAIGAQFAQPYVFKTLFSNEPIDFDDLFETKTVSVGALYLDMNESLPEDEHNYRFVGKAGAFCPIRPGCGGGLLLRVNDGKYYAATGSKGYRWLEAEVVKELGREDDIDREYYNGLVDVAVQDISKYGDIEWFMSESEDLKQNNDDIPPWKMECGKDDCRIGINCDSGCPNWIINDGAENECKLGYNAFPF